MSQDNSSQVSTGEDPASTAIKPMPIGPAIKIPDFKNIYDIFQTFTPPKIKSAEQTSRDLHIEQTKQSRPKIFDDKRVDEAVAEGGSANENESDGFENGPEVDNLQQLRNRHVEKVRLIKYGLPTYNTNFRETGQKRSFDDVIRAEISQNHQVSTGLRDIIKLTEEYDIILKQTRKKRFSSTTQPVE